MLNSTNGREKLLKVWRNQHRCCSVCGEPITSDTGFKVHKVFRHGKSPWLEMVHPECHTVLHKNDACFVAPGSLTGLSEKLEPYEGKLSRTVLRGGAGSNAILLPDQTLENKQKFISQIMTSKSPMRSCDDIDEQALSYAEIKALCAGDPRIREKMDLDVQVAKLKVLRGDFQNQKYRLEDKLLKTFPEEIQKQKTRIAALQQDSQIAAAHPQDKENFCGMTIKGMVYDDKKAAGERLLLARQEMPNADMMLLGTYRGFELNIRFDSFKNEHQAVLRAELSYPVSLGDDARGNITRLDNAIDNFADRIADAENALQNLEQQKQAAEVEVAKPFAQEEELAEKSARLAELNALLNIDRDRSSSQDAPEETKEEESPAARPSVLAALEEKANQPEPVKPFRSYYDKDGDAR